MNAFTLVLLDAAIKGTVLLAVALCVVPAMRRASAAARHLVLTVAMLGLLALPALSTLLPAWRVLPIGPLAASQNPTSTQPAPSTPITPSLSEPAMQAIPVDDTTPRNTPLPSGQTELTAPLIVTSATPAAIRVEDLLHCLPYLWFTIALLALAPLPLSALALRRLERNAAPVTNPALLSQLDSLRGRLRLSATVQLLHTPNRSMPMTWGLIHPRILLPTHLLSDLSAVEPVLLHELAHIQRRDCLIQCLAHVACAMHWFNPLAWLIARRMVTERERACDDVVLTTLSVADGATTYADRLLQIASGLRSRRHYHAAAIAMARPSKLEGRLLAILDNNRNRNAVNLAGALAAIFIAAVVMVPVAMLKAAGESADPSADMATGQVDPQPTDESSEGRQPEQTESVPPVLNPDVVDAKILELRKRQTVLEEQREMIRQQIHSREAWIRTQSPLIQVTKEVPNPELQTLLDRKAQTENELFAYLSKPGQPTDAHPTVQRLKDLITQLDAEITQKQSTVTQVTEQQPNTALFDAENQVRHWSGELSRLNQLLAAARLELDHHASIQSQSLTLPDGRVIRFRRTDEEKRMVIPDYDRRPVVLDLASGELLEVDTGQGDVREITHKPAFPR